MPTVLLTWMDGRDEKITLTGDDRLIVKNGVLSVVRGRYPFREDREMATNVPLVNLRAWVEYE